MMLESKSFIEQTYRSCLGVLRLAEKYGNDRLEAACFRAVSAGAANYGMLKNILQKQLDKISLQTEIEFTTPTHENIRGAINYC